MTSRRRPFLALLAAVVVACQASAPPASDAPSLSSASVRTLAVVVSAPAGAPVVGANVCAFTLAGTRSGCVETSASGTARLHLRPGAYSVLVTPAAPTRLAEGRTWADVLDADATSVVQLDPHSRIDGIVKDERGAAVVDAEVCAHPPLAIASPTCARTAAEGKFSIDVRSDVYKLDVTGPPGGKLIAQWASGRLSSGDADLVDVRSADADGIGVTMIKGVLLSGVVRGPSGAIEGAQVCTRTLAAPLPWDCVRTNKKGSYLALMEPGRYYMWTVPPDNVRLVAQWYDDVLEGVDTRFPTGRICRPTAADGSYTVTTRPQTYTVQVLAPPESDLINEFWLRKRTWVDANDISLGNADRTLDLTLRKGVRVSGVIRDTRGVPLEGATINLNDADGPLIGTDTDISGSYHMVVPPGTYQVEVFAPFRGERGDLLSQPPRELVVNGYINYDVVLEDANP